MSGWRRKDNVSGGLQGGFIKIKQEKPSSEYEKTYNKPARASQYLPFVYPNKGNNFMEEYYRQEDGLDGNGSEEDLDVFENR